MGGLGGGQRERIAWVGCVSWWLEEPCASASEKPYSEAPHAMQWRQLGRIGEPQ